MSEQFYFKQFSLNGVTTPSQSGPGSNGSWGVLHIPQSSSITGTSPLDCLVSYQDTCWVGGGILSLSREAVGVFYSPCDWARGLLIDR